MSPENVENFNRNEGQQNFGQERFHDLELGDVDQSQLQINQAQNQFTQQQQQNNNQNVDPVEFIKKMISAGFTPSRAQISAAASNLSGPSESTNTWFAIFLQKILRQQKNKRS